VGPTEYAVATYDLLGRAVGDVYPVYQRLLAHRNAYDFDDLLSETVTLLECHEEAREHYSDRFLHVLVDEYQDTNHAQYRILKALAREHGNICVVGDDDQSIYGWRGADLRNILDFERDFPGSRVVSLEQNYRSTGAILEVANAVIAHNRERKPKRLSGLARLRGTLSHERTVTGLRGSTSARGSPVPNRGRRPLLRS
jgi:superfamily I DNA/RNA helicase